MKLGIYETRPYQDAAIAKLRAEMKSLRDADKPQRVILQLPTGAGKTVTSSAIMALSLAKGRRCGFLASGRILIKQKSLTLNNCGIEHRVIMADQEEFPMTMTTEADCCIVASKDTIHARKLCLTLDLLIVDECRIALAESWNQIVAQMRCPVIGLDATPARNDGRGLGGFFSSMVTSATYESLVRDGYLVPCRMIAPFTVDMEGVKPNSSGDWSAQQNDSRFNQAVLIGEVVQNWIKFGEDRQTFVYAMTVAHATELRQRFNGSGIPTSLVHAKTPDAERDDIYARFRDGRDRIICNVGVLAAGADFPNVSCGVLAFATKSLVKYRQICGRLFRIYDGKRDGLVIDHGGNYERFGWPQDDIDWPLSEDKACEPRKNADGTPIYKASLCPKCREIWRRGPVCSKCGYVPTGREQPRLVRVVDGELREVRRKSPKKRIQETDKHKAWMKSLAICAHRNMTASQAKILFKKFTGDWPSSDLHPWPKDYEWSMRVAALWPGFVRKKKDTTHS